MIRWILGLMAIVFVTATPAHAVTLQNGDLYTQAELEKDAVRLRVAVLKIYEKGIRPFLSDEEKALGGDVKWDFSFPGEDEVLLNFYSTPTQRSITLPILSLKAMEDTTTAYAWLYFNKKNLGSIDLYYTMLRYRDRGSFPGGKLPPILKALGIPDDALQDKRVDELSLSLRNEAFAFIIAHELGHIRYRHLTTEGLSMADIRAGERDADNFAFDVLGRTKTPTVGAVLFFQAQLYSHTHRAEFPTRDKWENFLRKQMTHPLGVDRINAMASYLEGPLAQSRPTETMTWREIGAKLRQMLPAMEDTDIANCMIKMAKKSDLSILHPHSPMSREAHMQICYGL